MSVHDRIMSIDVDAATYVEEAEIGRHVESLASYAEEVAS